MYYCPCLKHQFTPMLSRLPEIGRDENESLASERGK